MNKSLITNLLAILVIVIGYFSPWQSKHILSVGIFAFSGAITNWLAVHMLFEKVPFLYGSGVIPTRFQEFKSGIKDLIMGQFFSAENMTNFFKTATPSVEAFNFPKVVDAIDYNKMFDGLTDVIINDSPFGGMLSMFGGVEALAPLRAPFENKMRVNILSITESESFIQVIQENLATTAHDSNMLKTVEEIVDKRLNELTPKMVKEIVQDMIKKHLGWLVVWGGVFGGIIGLAMSFI